MDYADQSFGALLFALLSLPITLMILSNLVQAFYSKTKYVTVEKVVEVEVPVYIHPPTVPNKPRKAQKTNIARATTPDKVKTEALQGLRTLGLTSAEGRSLISKTVKNCTYKNSERLLKDCMANM